MVYFHTGATIMLIASSLIAIGIGIVAVAVMAAVAIGLLWITRFFEDLAERFLG